MRQAKADGERMLDPVVTAGFCLLRPAWPPAPPSFCGGRAVLCGQRDEVQEHTLIKQVKHYA